MHHTHACPMTVKDAGTPFSTSSPELPAQPHLYELGPFITLNCSHRLPLCCNNPPMLGLSYSSLPQLNATLVIRALGEICRIVLERASRLKSLGLFYIKAGSVRTQQGRASGVINHTHTLGPQAFCWQHTFCLHMWPHYSISHKHAVMDSLWFTFLENKRTSRWSCHSQSVFVLMLCFSSIDQAS